MNARQVKDALNTQFSRIAKAMSNPRRIELLELLGQAERSVEELAAASGMDFSNTSAQLQVMGRARLVGSRREGKRVVYSLATDGVTRFLIELRDLSRERLAEVEQVTHEYFETRDHLEPLAASELLARMRRGNTLLLDVRPTEEFEAGHIAGAISFPLADLKKRLGELPPDADIVAYCRGPYCVLAPQAMEILRAAGFQARRMQVGFPEWRLANLPVAMKVTV